MKTREQIEGLIAVIEADVRLSYPAANITINAPLALIQIELKAELRALKWALTES